MAKKSRGRSPQKKGRPIPKCKAILLCERVIIDSETGTASAIAIFNSFIIDGELGLTQPFTIYMHLTGGIGTYQMQVEIVDLKDDQVHVDSDAGALEFTDSDRVEIKRVIVKCPEIPFKNPGNYELVVTADGKPVEHVRFQVRLVSSEDLGLESGEEHDDDDEEEGEEDSTG